MHIKQLVVCGFKSYKGKTVVEDIDEGVNVIVGRNGSGKSNLFAAIEFALTTEYRYLRPTDRSSLMYQGKATQDAAYVEIVFDNSDRKLPVDEKTVTFRRMLATKKDKFYVNGKELSNAKQFLDIAGFTNPYFIVKQGKVNQLAAGSDEIRLKLFHDVAGCLDYDKNINHCKRSLRDGETKQMEIQKTLTRLGDRIKLLDQEATELKEYLKVDKIGRAIEYIINAREVDAVDAQVEKCAEKREDLAKKQGPFKIELTKLTKKYEKIHEDLGLIRQEIRGYEDKKEVVQSEILSLVSEIAKLKNQKEDLEKKIDTQSDALSEEIQGLYAEHGENERVILRTSKTLSEVKEKDSVLFSKYVKLEVLLKEMEKNVSCVAGKLPIRKKELTHELKDITNTLQDNSRRENKVRKEAEKLTGAFKRLISEEKGIEAQLDTVRAELKRLEQARSLPARNILDQKRVLSDLYRKLNEVDQNVSRQKEMRSNIMEQFIKRAGRPLMNAWEGVEQVIQTFKNRGDQDDVVKGYYGLVIENIQCEETVDRAVESALGKKLFYHIVQDSSVGIKILKEFNRQRLKGDVSFIFLDKLNSRSRPVPDDDRNYRPLIENVGFPHKLKKAAEFLFGKTLLANSLENAVLAAKLHKWNSVTIDGDKIESGGPITGGFTESVVGRLELYRNKKQSETAITKLREEKRETEAELRTFSKTVEESAKNNETLDTKRSSLKLERERLTSMMKILLEKRKHLESSLEQVAQTEENLKRSQMELKCRQEAIKQTLGSNTVSHTMKDMKNAENLRKEMKVVGAERTEVISQLKALEATLEKAKQVKRRLTESIEDEKNKQSDRLSYSQREVLATELDSMIKDFCERMKIKKTLVQEITTTLRTLKSNLAASLENSVTVGDERLKIETELIKLGKEMECVMSLHLSVSEKLKELKIISSKIASVPSEVNKYANFSSNELYEKLKKIKSRTLDNDGVNQKALEQYEELNTKYEEFTAKLQNLELEKSSLYECIEDLGERRSQAAYKCFVTLQQEFQDIFSTIVTSGRAELVLYSADFELTSSNMNDPEVQQEFGRTEFTGLKINVNFVNKRVENMKNLMSLSGGQKTLVALSLILAVQKIDPVPFYLFDEVDQALDPQYRKSVAKMMQGLASKFNLQFVCTTFRKEFVRGADKVFGVSYAHKASNVKVITPADALDFVESESSETIDELSQPSEPSESTSDDSSGEAPGNLMEDSYHSSLGQPGLFSRESNKDCISLSFTVTASK